MSGATDSGMVKTMGIVMGCLGVIAVVCVIAARMLSGGTGDFDDPVQRNALIQRIQPIAAVRTSADELPADNVVADASASGAKSAEELVNGACAACHVAGVAGAPKLDDDAAWAERREAGLDALVASVINGKGSMPARGGSTYSDEEITLAVQQMAGFEVAEAPSEETVAAADEPAETEQAETEQAETEQAETEQAETEQAETEQAETEQAETEQAETEQAETEQAETEQAETEQAETEAAEESTESAAVAEAAPLIVGQVPEGLTDNVKVTVDGICAGCHLAGVAGAPKHGDTAAWQERADKGMAVLTASVINGLNVMPPRGGSALTDEEIPVAIQYLMSK